MTHTEGWYETDDPAKLVTSPDQLGYLFEKLNASPIIGIDTETTGLDYMRDQLHGISVAVDDQEWYITGGALLASVAPLREIARNPKHLFIGHNIKFDLHFLMRHNIRPASYADIMVAQWLVDENQSLGLKPMAKRRLGIDENLPEYKTLLTEAKRRLSKSKMSDCTIYDIPEVTVGTYAARDARITYDLWLKLAYDLREESMESLFWDTEMPFLWLLYQMEENGVCIDAGAVGELEVEFKEASDRLRGEWDTLTHGVNPNSPKQLGKYLFEDLKLPAQGKTKSGNDQVDELVLQRLEPMDTTGSIKILREMKKYEKLLGTYVEKFQILPFEGRLHGSFNQTGTVTGRLSSSDPNLQNIPARGDLGKRVRNTFIAAPGYDLVVIDYSQIELRRLAHESKEQAFIKIFLEDGDPHQMTADLAHVERHIGKAQPLDAPVLTPQGWVTMGEIQSDSYVVGADGLPAKVLAVYPQGIRPIYRVTMNDGTSVECDEEHLWNVRNRTRGQWATRTLREIMDRGLYEKGGNICRFEIPLTEPVQFPEKDLPVDPYLFGVLLGNGSFRGSSITLSLNKTDAEEVAELLETILPGDVALRKTGDGCLWLLTGNVRSNSLLESVRSLNLWGTYSHEKHVPAVYLLGSVSQRLALLRGLMDTDGCASKDQLLYSTTSVQLREAVVELVQSLGGIARWRVGTHAVEKVNHECFEVCMVFPNGINPFSVTRKASRVRPFKRGNSRRIQSVQFVGYKEAQCILVDNADHLYLTKSYNVTHNTLNFAWAYGSGPRTLADTIEKNGYPRPAESDAKEWLDNFNSAYPTLVRWKFAVINRARELGYVPTVSGHRRHLPELNHFDKGIRAAAERQCVNARIQGCKSATSRVATTRGYVTMQELFDAQESGNPYTLLTYTGETSDYKVYSTGKKPVYSVRTNKGFDTVSAEHRFFTYSDKDLVMKTLSDLREGDHIVARSVRLDGAESGFSEEDAELVGILLGDGSYSGKRDQFYVSLGSNHIYGEHVQNVIRAVFGSEKHIAKTLGKGSKGENWNLTVSGKAEREHLLSLGLERVSKENKAIPEWVYTAPLGHREAVLRGMYDTDGCLQSGCYVSFTNISRNLAEGFMLLVQSLGIPCTLETHSGYKGGKKVWRAKILSRDDSQRFIEMVRPAIQYKASVTMEHAKSSSDSVPFSLQEAVANAILSSEAWGETTTSYKELTNKSYQEGTWKTRIMGFVSKKNFSRSDQSWVYRMRKGEGAATKEGCISLLSRVEQCPGKENLMDLLNLRWAKILSIEEAGEQDTYDIEIFSTEHAYIGQGLLEHNSCADMIKWAMLQVSPWCNWYGAKMLLQVHDELVFEVPRQNTTEFAQVAQNCMQSVEQQFDSKVPIKADPGTGHSWGAAKH